MAISWRDFREADATNKFIDADGKSWFILGVLSIYPFRLLVFCEGYEQEEICWQSGQQICDRMGFPINKLNDNAARITKISAEKERV